MGILDDAIKEHLELKRQHGAGESELRKIEDEAFGASERPGDEAAPPDALAEAPTQFMTQPELGGEQDVEAGGEAREVESQEPEPPSAEQDAETSVVEGAPSRGRTEIADLQEPPAESVEAVEEAPAVEHEAIAEAAAAEEQEAPAAEETAGPSTEERHAIAEQPTEMYDVEAELGEAEPPDAEPEVHALSEEDEEFWDEKRLSDELDQALEAPVESEEPEVRAAPEAVDDQRSVEQERQPEPQLQPEDRESRGKSEDVLDETPDFLEEAPEDDQLWFEQKPPKDFDFDD